MLAEDIWELLFPFHLGSIIPCKQIALKTQSQELRLILTVMALFERQQSMKGLVEGGFFCLLGCLRS